MSEWATYSSTRLGNINVPRPASNINLLFLPGGQRAVLKDVNDYLNQNQISTTILIFESKQNHREENIHCKLWGLSDISIYCTLNSTLLRQKKDNHKRKSTGKRERCSNVESQPPEMVQESLVSLFFGLYLSFCLYSFFVCVCLLVLFTPKCTFIWYRMESM